MISVASDISTSAVDRARPYFVLAQESLAATVIDDT